MATKVEAAGTIQNKQSPWAVFGLSIVTLGFYLGYWWYRTHRDLAVYETAATGSSSINVRTHAIVGGAYAAFLAAWFVVDIQHASVHSGTITNGTTTTYGTQASSSSPIAGLLFLASVVLSVIMLNRMRSTVLRLMTAAGVLPEDRPGAVGAYLCSVFLNVTGMAVVSQTHLNLLWDRFPRYYDSIGGTQEAMYQQAGGAVPSLVAPIVPVIAAPAAPVIAAPAAPALMPPSATPAPAPVAPVPVDPQAAARQLLSELGPKATAGTITVTEALQYAGAVVTVHGADQALPWYQWALQHEPANAAANYAVGAIFAQKRDAQAVTYLRRAVADPAYAPHAQALLTQLGVSAA